MIHNPTAIGPCVLVLGMFDGVHRGHQELLMQGGERAEKLKVPLVVSTFEPHPLEVLFPDKAPKRLTTLQERAEIMAGYGCLAPGFLNDHSGEFLWIPFDCE
ncbi:MAG: hypothetical protein K6A68_00735, partial [Clostridiales bacterium]|nr:hypothetical protein [Clostridiales bacterium]